MSLPLQVLLIDIDGLRRDVLLEALRQGDLPHIERIVGGAEGAQACHVPAVSTAPSITFTAQASIITGCQPYEHGIPGNESFDRFGRISDGAPRHFGFDVGDTLAVDDAVAVFKSGLASRFLRPESPTMFERFTGFGRRAATFYHMYARGARDWIAPSIASIARFTKGRGLLGLEAGQYDARMVRRVLSYLDRHPRPEVLLAYFMGLDHHSHLHGPASQVEYLRTILDPQIGQLLEGWARHGGLAGTLVVLVSDHGQIDATPDDRHALQLGFPFDLEFARVFTALGLDVHDKPGEDPNCDAVMGLNGGMAHVYLQHRAGRWADPPRYQEDVLPVAQAFFDMNVEGRYAEELAGTLELVLLRDVEQNGWRSPYQVYTGNGQTQPLDAYLMEHPELGYVDPVNRLQALASEVTGDILLIARGREGYYFGSPLRGVHGGLLPGESEPVLTFALPAGAAADVAHMRRVIECEIAARCSPDGSRQPSVADMAPALIRLVGVMDGD